MMLLVTLLSCSTMLLRMRSGVLIGSRYTVVKVLLELLMQAYTLPSCTCPCQCYWGSLLLLLFPLLSYDYDDLLLLTHGDRYRLQYARTLLYVCIYVCSQPYLPYSILCGPAWWKYILCGRLPEASSHRSDAHPSHLDSPTIRTFQQGGWWKVDEFLHIWGKLKQQSPKPLRRDFTPIFFRNCLRRHSCRGVWSRMQRRTPQFRCPLWGARLEEAMVRVPPEARPNDRKSMLAQQSSNHGDIHAVKVDFPVPQAGTVFTPVIP